MQLGTNSMMVESIIWIALLKQSFGKFALDVQRKAMIQLFEDFPK